MKQYDTLDAFAADLTTLTEEVREKLRGQDSLFLLKTKQGRECLIRLEDGIAKLIEPDGSQPDCTVTADEKTLLDLINGKASPVKALLFGKIAVKGDIGRLKRLIDQL